MASTASFVRAMRTLLWHPPRQAATEVGFLVEEVEEAPAVASDANEEVVVAPDEKLPVGREWRPRTALDFSGHCFAKNVQVKKENQRVHYFIMGSSTASRGGERQ